MKRQSSRKLFHQKAHSPHKKYIYIYFFSDIFFWVSGLEKEKGCSFSWSIFYGREMSIFYEGLGLGLEKWGEVNGVLVNELGKCREKRCHHGVRLPTGVDDPQTRLPNEATMAVTLVSFQFSHISAAKSLSLVWFQLLFYFPKIFSHFLKMEIT